MNGILLIDKEEDWTSHDVVAKLRGILKQRRIGHAGTLDPLATGLLTIFVGGATKAVQFAEAAEKTYITHLKLGITTDTQDITGTVLTKTKANVSREALEAILPQYIGDIMQVPPMYSALKVDGERLYKLARKGVEVTRAPRPVTIGSIDILEELEDGFSLAVTCSKGTYIRTLCHDIGQTLGVGATMAALRRTAVGNFLVDNAHSLEKVQMTEEKSQLFLPLDSLFVNYPRVVINQKQEERLRWGQVFPVAEKHLDVCAVYNEQGEFLSLGKIMLEDGNVLKAVKNFFTE